MIGQAAKKSPPARKQKTCANPECATKFVPAKLGQKVCGWACGLAIAPANQDRARKALEQRARKEIRVQKEKLKPRAAFMREAQTAFNAWIRERDIGLPCVSCGRHHNGQWHAGHYRTVGGNPELRFEPLNVWRQCAPCNNHKSGDIVNYRIELVKRIGAENLAWLEGPHEPQRYTIEQLKEMKAHYRALIRDMKGRESA